MENEYVLKMEGIAKEYYGNRVLKGVELKVKRGEIHALMGENGAGKSTLMNILFGMPVIHSTGGFEGTIEFDGKPVNIDNPSKAMELGIGMVHQEFMLIPGFTVTENVKLGPPWQLTPARLWTPSVCALRSMRWSQACLSATCSLLRSPVRSTRPASSC